MTESEVLILAVSAPLYKRGPGESYPRYATSKPLLGIVRCLSLRAPKVPFLSSVVLSTYFAIDLRYYV